MTWPLHSLHRWHLALGLPVLVAALGCTSSDEIEPTPIPPQDGELTALSYNVAGLPQGISGSNPETNTPLMSPMLNSYELVLVQEDFVYHAELSAQADHPYQSEPKVTHLKLVNDGLNRFSQFPWTGFERVQWVACYGDASTGASDCMAEKGFSLARTQFGERVVFDVYNHHAEAGGGPEDVAARTEGFAQLTAYIQQHSSGNVVIVGGDTNLHGDDPEDLPILEDFKAATGLRDVCEVVTCSSDRIDRFFFRDNDRIHLEPVAWAIAEEFVDGDGEDLSDHLAIHVTFAWHTK